LNGTRLSKMNVGEAILFYSGRNREQKYTTLDKSTNLNFFHQVSVSVGGVALSRPRKNPKITFIKTVTSEYGDDIDIADVTKDIIGVTYRFFIKNEGEAPITEFMLVDSMPVGFHVTNVSHYYSHHSMVSCLLIVPFLWPCVSAIEDFNVFSQPGDIAYDIKHTDVNEILVIAADMSLAPWRHDSDENTLEIKVDGTLDIRKYPEIHEKILSLRKTRPVDQEERSTSLAPVTKPKRTNEDGKGKPENGDHQPEKESLWDY